MVALYSAVLSEDILCQRYGRHVLFELGAYGRDVELEIGKDMKEEFFIVVEVIRFFFLSLSLGPTLKSQVGAALVHFTSHPPTPQVLMVRKTTGAW